MGRGEEKFWDMVVSPKSIIGVPKMPAHLTLNPRNLAIPLRRRNGLRTINNAQQQSILESNGGCHVIGGKAEPQNGPQVDLTILSRMSTYANL